jgi:hypothetical protein
MLYWKKKGKVAKGEAAVKESTKKAAQKTIHLKDILFIKELIVLSKGERVIRE